MAPGVPHGGNVLRMALDHDLRPDSILDFSANVNPRGLPECARERLQQASTDPPYWQEYPDQDYTALRSALAHKHTLPVESILVGAGAVALLSAAMQALRPSRCLVPIPSFSEYAHFCACVGAKVDELVLREEDDFRIDSAVLSARLGGHHDCLVLTNPHNPSGALLIKEEVLAFLKSAQAQGVFVIVDEAFIDYAPDESVVQYAARQPNVAVVRSLTKFYGCPGLRVGFLVAAPETVVRIAPSVPTWSVTTLAAATVEEALRDEAYVLETLQSNSTQRALLVASLSALGAEVFPSSANFVLVRLQRGWPDSSATRELLLRHRGIAVRDCNSYTGLQPGKFIRVAVRTAAENQQLLEGLREIWKK